MKRPPWFFLFLLVVAGCASTGGREISPGGPAPFATTIVEIYQGPLDHLHAVRPGHCPMHPSCSAYAQEAMERHGFVTGWAMAMDRLMRCGRDEERLSPRIWTDGRWKIYDPVDANDFWWRNPVHW
jgi:hypothetical protein